MTANSNSKLYEEDNVLRITKKQMFRSWKLLVVTRGARIIRQISEVQHLVEQ